MHACHAASKIQNRLVVFDGKRQDGPRANSQNRQNRHADNATWFLLTREQNIEYSFGNLFALKLL